MSSHHVVRDNQEPALVILNGASWAVVQDLLEWMPMIVVDGEALDVVLPWGIKIDTVIHSAHERDDVTRRTEHQQPLHLIERTDNQSGFDAALTALSNKNYPAINIVCGEIDWEAVDQFASQHTLVIHADGWRWSYLRHGHIDKIVPMNTPYQIRGENESARIATDGRIRIANNNPVWLGERG